LIAANLIRLGDVMALTPLSPGLSKIAATFAGAVQA
jgi:hypothetical protein